MADTGEAKRTALYDEHVRLGGRMVEYAGFEMPIQYSGVIDEHTAVRERAGLFDVSHMGEVFITGPGALDFVQRISCNDCSKLKIGRAKYTGLMYPEGTFVDDMLVHRMGDEELMLVINAANIAKDFDYIASLAAREDDVSAENRSDAVAQLALQGPAAEDILRPLADVDLSEIRFFRFVNGEVGGREALIARTGYTGENGFELYLDPEDATHMWRSVLEAGRDHGISPAGLGARDTLRLEAGMCLYGNDIDRTTTPFEAGLDWIVKLDKGDFIGRDVLQQQAENGVQRRLVGFEMVGRGIARHGYDVALEEDGEAVGHVTSGTHSPTLQRAIGMAYVPPAAADVGTPLWIEIRKRRVEARVVEMPFYSRTRPKSGSKS